MTEVLQAPVAPADEWTLQAEGVLQTRVTEVRELRDVPPLPDLEHGPLPIYEQLREVRARMDQVEVILNEVLSFRTRARALLREAEATVDDKWAERVTQPRQNRRKSFDGSFDAAPREKYAEADLAVLSDRKKARKRERIMDACGDAVDQIRTAYRGLDGVRSDLHLMMRGLSVETRLER